MSDVDPGRASKQKQKRMQKRVQMRRSLIALDLHSFRPEMDWAVEIVGPLWDRSKPSHGRSCQTCSLRRSGPEGLWRTVEVGRPSMARVDGSLRVSARLEPSGLCLGG